MAVQAVARAEPARQGDLAFPGRACKFACPGPGRPADGGGSAQTLGRTLIPTVKLDVFGTRMLVERCNGTWRTYLLGVDGKRSLVNVSIPESLTQDELVQYFDDLFHEAAIPRRPAVVRLD